MCRGVRSVLPYVCLTFPAVSAWVARCVCLRASSDVRVDASVIHQLFNEPCTRCRSSRWKHISRREDNESAHSGCPWAWSPPILLHKLCFLCCLVNQQIKWLRFHRLFSFLSSEYVAFLSAAANRFRPALFALITQIFENIALIFLGVQKVFFLSF